MQRKLVKQGTATMMISLPSKWIKANSLEKGDEVNIEEKENTLNISTRQALKQKKEITIQINQENQQDVVNILTHLYRKGFDRITLQGINAELLKQIRGTTNNLLLGFELIQKTSNQCIIENISEPDETKYETILKKIFLIIKETQEIIIQDFEQEKFLNMQEMQESKNQQDKFILFCRRLLVKQKTNSLLEWELLTFLMHIQHAYYYLYEYTVKNKLKSNKEINNLLEKQKNYFNLLEDAYYNKNIKSIHKINNLKNQYQFGECIKLIEKAKAKEAVVYSYIKDIFRLIQIGSSPVLSELLDKEELKII